MTVLGFFIVLLVVLLGVAIAFDLRDRHHHWSTARKRRGKNWTIGNM